jgi:hypothetical protein
LERGTIEFKFKIMQALTNIVVTVEETALQVIQNPVMMHELRLCMETKNEGLNIEAWVTFCNLAHLCQE